MVNNTAGRSQSPGFFIHTIFITAVINYVCIMATKSIHYQNIIIEKTDSHFSFINPVQVLDGFDHSNLIGLADIIVKDGVMYANITVTEDVEGRYPAIGWRATKQVIGDENVFTEGIVFCIGVCIGHNEDATILPFPKAPK